MRDGAHRITNSLQGASRGLEVVVRKEDLGVCKQEGAVLKGGLYDKARLPTPGGGASRDETGKKGTLRPRWEMVCKMLRLARKKGRKWGRGGLADPWEAAEERGE